MQLIMNISGIDFYFQIHNYFKSNIDDWYYEWSKLSLKLFSQNWLNYEIQHDEIMLMSEIEKLRDNLDDLINDELTEKQSIEFLEPDLSFVLSPKFNIRNNPNILYVKEGYEIADITMDFEVNFWDPRDGAATANKLTLCFDREEIEIFLDYLNFITGNNIDSDRVSELIERGIFVE